MSILLQFKVDVPCRFRPWHEGNRKSQGQNPNAKSNPNGQYPKSFAFPLIIHLSFAGLVSEKDTYFLAFKLLFLWRGDYMRG
jgi:hypothetical protein